MCSCSQRGMVGWVLAGASLLAVCLASCGDDTERPPVTNTIVPQSWAGVWRFELAATDCTSGESLSGYVSFDTLCTGDDISQELQELQTWCSGGSFDITTTTLRYDCDQSFSEGGCRVTVNVHLFGTLDEAQGIAQGTGQTRMDVSPAGSVCGQSQCANLALTATRIAPQPDSCGAR